MSVTRFFPKDTFIDFVDVVDNGLPLQKCVSVLLLVNIPFQNCKERRKR